MCGLPGTALQRAYRQSDHAAFDRCKRRLFGRDRRLPEWSGYPDRAFSFWKRSAYLDVFSGTCSGENSKAFWHCTSDKRSGVCKSKELSDVYPNQWQQLQNVKKLSKEFIDKKINEWAEDGVLGALSDLENMDKEENGEVSEDNVENLQKAALNGHSQQTASQKSGKKSKPWKKRKLQFYPEDVSGQIQLVLANGIYIEKENLQPRMQNTLRRMAAYSNPQYYKNHAMGFSNRDNPRIVACFEEFDDYIRIPRGLREILPEKLKEAGIPYEVSDERQKGKSICVDFSAELYPEQRKASEQMLRYENGILHAATAFGKTAVGAYLIAARKMNTLILVHNKEIMNNWVEDLQKFLDINEEPPEYTTPKGRVKRRKSVIGTRYAGHDSMTGIIDVVMISSLGKPGNIDTVVKDYGMVLIDECHHCASDTAEAVVKEVSAR